MKDSCNDLRGGMSKKLVDHVESRSACQEQKSRARRSLQEMLRSRSLINDMCNFNESGLNINMMPQNLLLQLKGQAQKTSKRE